MRLKISFIGFLCWAFWGNAVIAAEPDKLLIVSPDGHFLQYRDGTPFFYLADTAWELFHRLTREEADDYLADRAERGFTAIQAVVLAEINGLDVPNAYGHTPLKQRDPTMPDTLQGDGNDYWDHVDYVVRRANKLGLCVAMLPTWGCHWHDGTPVFNPQNAREYGRYLGRRYKDAHLIWVLGGDRNPENEQHRAIIRQMAEGLKEGDGGAHLCTYHPTGWHGSAQFFHNEAWLDFNMRQNGHEVEFESYAKTCEDYFRQPAKPVIDGEPIYEDHPVAFQADRRGHSVSADVRRALYWDLFNGACGHTYGHHSVWQMYDPGKQSPVNTPLMSWREALARPGVSQMVYARKLLESRPCFTRVPATDRVIVPHEVSTAVPGAGRYRLVAICDTEGTYAMVYVPVGRRFSVRMDVIKGAKVKAWWFNPRTGKARALGVFPNAGVRTFDTPAPGEYTDWVLVLDDVSRHYPAPGKMKRQEVSDKDKKQKKYGKRKPT